MESGKVLVKQGLPCDGLHFLVEGEVRVIVNDMMQQHQVEEGQLYNKTDSKTDRVDQHTHLGLHETLRSLCTEYVQVCDKPITSPYAAVVVMLLTDKMTSMLI